MFTRGYFDQCSLANSSRAAGKISFSPQLHSVFGRSYRVIVVNDNKAKVVGQITAKSPAKIH